MAAQECGLRRQECCGGTVDGQAASSPLGSPEQVWQYSTTTVPWLVANPLSGSGNKSFTTPSQFRWLNADSFVTEITDRTD